MIDLSVRQARPGLFTILRRGARGLCPNCGGSPLLRSYLKPVSACGECGEPYAHIRSDDAAPWLTMLIVGHIVVPLALVWGIPPSVPIWVLIGFWQLLAVVLIATILPRAKTFLMAAIWMTNAPGSERDA